MKKQSRNILFYVIGLLIVAVIVVVALVTAQPKTPAVELSANQILQDGKPFRLISPNKQHPVVRTMAAGFWQACEDLKVDCVDNSFEGVDFTLMAPQIDIAISQGTSGAIPFTDKAVLEQDMRLIDAGIPSIVIHGKVDPVEFPGYLGWVAADAEDYAIRAAIAMGEKLEGKGVVAITQGNLNDVENLVADTFTKTLNEKFPEIVVLEPQMEGFDQPAAIAVASSYLTSNPEITGAFGTTGASPTTWAKALEQKGYKAGDVIVIGMDYTRQNLDLVKADWVYALVGQPLFEELYRAVELLVDNLNGRSVNYDNIYPAPIIFKADLDKYYEIADTVDGK